MRCKLFTGTHQPDVDETPCSEPHLPVHLLPQMNHEVAINRAKSLTIAARNLHVLSSHLEVASTT